MSEVLLFNPVANRTCKDTLAQFNRFCREELTVYGSDLPFDALSWDISKYVNLRGHKKAFRLFFTIGDPRRDLTPLRAPFGEFARSYVRYAQGLKPVEDTSRRLSAMRVMHDALAGFLKFPCVTRLSSVILNRAASLARERYGPKFAYQVGVALEHAAALIEDLRLSQHSIAAWRNPIPKEKDLRSRIGHEFDQRRAECLISDEEIMALSRAYLMASEPVDSVFSALAVLMSCSPDRINEVLSLPLDCEVETKNAAGELTYGLRWRGSKGAKDHLKLIPPTMVPFAKEAVGRIRLATEEARRIAAWYEKYPNRLYLPERLEHLRQKEFLEADEFASIAAVSAKHKGDWYNPRGVRPSSERPWRIRFADVERAILDELPPNFPIFDKRTELKFSEALCVVQEKFTRTEWATSPCMITEISINQVNQQLGSAIANGKSSIFSRNGITLLDGSAISLTTHCFRHMLNTMGQSAGLGEFEIALWSGRKDQRQNAAYDHVPAKELLDELDQLFGDDLTDTSRSPVSVRRPLSVHQMRALDVQTAHTTDLGACVSDFVLQPCAFQLDCENCDAHIYTKGDVDRNERVRRRHEFHCNLLDKAQLAVAAGTMGANRWLEHHRLMVDRLAGLIEILDDPSVPDGTLIRLSRDGVATLIEAGPSTRRPVVFARIASRPAIQELLTEADELANTSETGRFGKNEEARQQFI